MHVSAEKTRSFNVLFVCPANSARSVMAEAIMNCLSGRRFRAWSAGLDPVPSDIDPYALSALARAGLPVEGLCAKSYAEFTGPNAPEFDFVFVLAETAEQVSCPPWAGDPMIAHWEIPDPAGVEGDDVMKHLAFAETFRMLCNRIGGFTALPSRSLDRMTLHYGVHEAATAAA